MTQDLLLPSSVLINQYLKFGMLPVLSYMEQQVDNAMHQAEHASHVIKFMSCTYQVWLQTWDYSRSVVPCNLPGTLKK